MDTMATTSSEDDAKVLFRKGVDYEREGFHYEATRCYKRALKLDPDVEKKIADEELVSRSMDTTDENNVSNDKSEDEYDNKEDLFLRFQRILGPLICFPARPQLTTHFSALPPELVIYIFRWVVSYDLDLRMLEQCAAVCRGWYLCARDPELWRRACSKFWPSNVNDLVPYDGNWRQMFIERPNVLTIGCYICKITYVRRGEESFRDNTNGPSFQVVYYRYLRFFSDGRVLMVLSYNPPYKIVRKLQTREKAPFNVSPGHYRLSGTQLFLTLDSEDKERDREFNKKYGWEDNTERKTTYNMVLEISKYKSKQNWKLQCIDYEIVYQSRVNKVKVTKYDLTNNRFPPFIFSRVKCYSNESERVL
ncbi:F-box only protein 9 isoform X2 [Metopolophium dirhodum]|uniref:F-box only protein 9 isoform X2 n=1 Tax=Metopolophium dirhodum TaxID=44670 RepID=UPI00298FB883|nr:F-box only protein 9 isoform X2 [Metopolophium dirhodum]